jgi:hypothetical protein
MCAELAASTRVRAALLTLFKGFTFDGGMIEIEPREEAIIGFHFLRDDEGVATEPFVEKTPLAMRGNIQSSGSPSQ